MVFIIKGYKRRFNNTTKIGETGVTLIGLIVTIIVLLILIAVIIKISSGNDGVINKAKKSAGLYQNAAESESEILSEYERECKVYLDVLKLPTISIGAEAGATSVKINLTTDNDQSEMNGLSLKYKIDNGTWQTSNVFDNLDPDKTYTFVAQVADNAGNTKESNQISIKPLGGVFVKLYDTNSDGTGDTLTFGNKPSYTYNGTLKNDYGNQNDKNITEKPLWNNDKNTITKADFVTNVKPISTAYWFSELSKLENINKIENLDTRDVTDMSYMFYNCTSLKNLDVSKFDTSNVTDMSDMFGDCTSLKNLDVSNFNTSKVTNMNAMFYHSGLTSLDVSKFNTSRVTNMSGMFLYCKDLASLDVRNFDTSKATTMESMFGGCKKLTYLNLSNFNTSNVTNMRCMFLYCQRLTSLDLSNFVTSEVINMYEMFYDCSSLTTIYADSNKWSTAKVTSSDKMFSSCLKLKGQNGTTYSSSNEDATYARIDGGTSSPGYFTQK